MTGIYLLIKDGGVVYVGQSINIERRIKQHTDKEFDSYEAIKCDGDLLDSAEAFYITLHNPKYNKRKYEINTNIKKPKEKRELTEEEKEKQREEFINFLKEKRIREKNKLMSTLEVDFEWFMEKEWSFLEWKEISVAIDEFKRFARKEFKRKDKESR